jgi:hypothetical protein
VYRDSADILVPAGFVEGCYVAAGGFYGGWVLEVADGVEGLFVIEKGRFAQHDDLF